MHTSGSYPKLNGNPIDVNSAATGSKPRLEDLINSLIQTEKTEAAKNLPSTSFGKTSIGSSLSEADALLAVLPEEIVSQLGIGGLGRTAIFEKIKSHHQQNRHNPVLGSANHVVYIDYDLDVERIRLFIGLKAKYRASQNVFDKASSAMFVIEQAVELTATGANKSFSGLKENSKSVALKLKAGTEFLSCREYNNNKLLPILSFKFYAVKAYGISSCCVKADVLPFS